MSQSVSRATVLVGFVLLLGVPLPVSASASAQAELPLGAHTGGGPAPVASEGEDSVYAPSGRGEPAALPQMEPGHARYIVVFKDSVKAPAALARSQARERDGEIHTLYRRVLKGYAATLPKDEVAALRKDPRVKHVTRDRIVRTAEQSTPTGIDRAFATANEGLAIDEGDNLRVDADVAVIDSGIDPEHPDLNVVARTDCVAPYAEEEYEECVDDAGHDGNGHGTHVAGTIGALDNDEGVVGVAPGVRLWAVKALADQNFAYFSWIVSAVEWVTERADRIEVANMSLSGSGSSPPLDEAIAASVEAGVVYVVAAGNNTADAKNYTPANSPDVITVSALADYDGQAGGEAEPLLIDLFPPIETCEKVDESGEENYGKDDTLANFSNYGETVEVAAPGVCILSTFPTTGSLLADVYGTSSIGDEYGTISGTSMASPHVAGAAAILAAESNPEDKEDVEAIRDTILEEGNSAWEDTSEDGIEEPLLDVGEEATFAPADQIAATGEAEVVSESEAILHGLVNPGGLETEYHFEYGTTAEYGTSVPASGKPVGSGSTFAPIEEAVEGLEGRTAYHYRLVATNEAGTVYGEDRVFGTTPPSVEAEAAGEVGANEATLKASVNPEGLETTYRFEYGATTEYGRHSPPLAAKPIGGGTEVVELAEAVGALDDDRTYHYRMVTESLAGRVYGEDRSFATEAGVWAEQEAVNPDVEGKESENTQLNDVSCAEPDECMAIGNVSDGQNIAFSESWDGEEWTDHPIPFPEDTKAQTAHDVSCISGDSCVAVGYRRELSSQLVLPLVASWDGEQWELETPPLPAGADRAELLGVDCRGASECWAVGAVQDHLENPGGNTLEQAFALRWDGVSWAVESLPSVGDSSQLNDVSCRASGVCMAVGWSYEGEEPSEPLALSRVDDDWEATPTPPGEEPPPENLFDYNYLVALSCWSPDGCIANLGERNAVVHWDGVEWTLESLPAPSGAFAPRVGSNGLSCVSAEMCMAAGGYSGWYSQIPYAASWDGGEWSLQPASDPTAGDEPQGWGSALNSVSCISTNRCVGVGAHSIVEGTRGALIERFLSPGPAAATLPASGLGPEQVTLNATIDPEGAPTTYQFQYGATTEYGSSVPAEPKGIGSGSEYVEVEEVIEGLEIGETYHFRVVATNETGTSTGQDRELAVPPAEVFGETGSGQGQFDLPLGLVTDTEGNAWIVDGINSRVQKLGPKGEYLDQFGEEGSGDGQFDDPVGVAIDPEGEILVADISSHRIQRFSAEGEYLDQFGEEGAGNGQLVAPAGIDIDAEGNVWVADSGNNRVQKFSSSGEYLDQFGEEGSGNGQLSAPADVAIDAQGNIWVVDSGNHRIEEFNAAGEYLSQFGEEGSAPGQLSAAVAVAADPAGGIWVADSGNDRFQLFSAGGEYLAQYGEAGSGPGQLETPLGIAVDASGNVWVSDSVNDRIQRWPVATAPGAITNPAEVYSDTAATLRATILPKGKETTYQFEYGETTVYGSKAPATPKSAGSGTGEVLRSAWVSGLDPETTYHYRVVATSSEGTSYGADRTFTTLDADVSGWLKEQVPLGIDQQVPLDGDFIFTSAEGTQFGCETEAEAMIYPGAAGEVTDFSFNAEQCEGAGGFADCQLESATVEVPWGLQAKEGGTIEVNDFDFTWTFAESESCEAPPVWHFEADELTATPDDAEAMTELAFEGEADVTVEGLGVLEDVAIGFEMDVAPEGVYGVET